MDLGWGLILCISEKPPEGGCITQIRTLSSSIVDSRESPCGKGGQNLP